VGPTVIYAPSAMKALNNSQISKAGLEKAALLITSHACPISDVRSTKEYRSDIVARLFMDGFASYFTLFHDKGTKAWI